MAPDKAVFISKTNNSNSICYVVGGIEMPVKKIRIVAFAVFFLIAGLVGGMLVSKFYETGLAENSRIELTEDYLKALDARLAGLPPIDQTFVVVSERVTPAVVTISSEKVISRGNMRQQIPEEFRRFFGDGPFNMPEGEQRSQALGSGVIVDSDGLIITNNHVVENAESIQITLSDKRKFDAELVGADSMSDLAVLRVKEKGLPAIELGNSDKLNVGEWVLAVGNPFSASLNHSVTAGIVSAKGRSSFGRNAVFQNFIQTDAAINPGNSGGALVNMKGELVGINTAIISRTGTYNGIGFAIPSNIVREIMGSLVKYGKVSRGYLGVYHGDIDDGLAKAFGLDKPRGALINEVIKDSPAEKAGLKNGDIILSVDGKEVDENRSLTNLIGFKAPGAKVKITYLRDGKEKETVVTLAERQDEEGVSIPLRNGSEEAQMMEELGLEIGPMNDAAKKFYKGRTGVIITKVKSGSNADKAGLAKNILIQRVGSELVSDADDFRKAIARYKSGDYVRIYGVIGDGSGTVAGKYFALQIP
jgi:serine protease Do